VNEDKPFPATNAHPNTVQDSWTTKSLTHGLWKKGVPKLSVLWLSEPDSSQHETGPGSDVSIAALESVDKRLADVLKALEEKKARDTTDIFIVSDHGDRMPAFVAEKLAGEFLVGPKLLRPDGGRENRHQIALLAGLQRLSHGNQERPWLERHQFSGSHGGTVQREGSRGQVRQLVKQRSFAGSARCHDPEYRLPPIPYLMRL
jgi:arylsulfatase A-like enzyme